MKEPKVQTTFNKESNKPKRSPRKLFSYPPLVSPSMASKKLHHHHFQLPASFFQQTSRFLFRQQGPLSDPISSPEDDLQARVNMCPLEHHIISVQPQDPTHCSYPHYYLIS